MLGHEVETGQEGSLSLPHLNQVSYLVVERTPVSLANVPYFSLLQDYQVEVIVDVSDYLLRVRYFGLEVLCEVIEGSV